MNARSGGKESGRDPSPGGRPAQAGGRPRHGPPATPERLEASALRYLERYAASSSHLRRLLMHKVRRSAELHGTDAEAGSAFVRALIQRLERSGILDDRRYAEGKALSLRRRGGSARSIRATLKAKGLASAQADRALDAADEGEVGAEADLAAARRLARRRSLGPWRLKDRAGHRLKDLAALGRAGFSYNVARAVIDGAAEEE